MKFLYDPIKGLNSFPPPNGVRLSQDFGQALLDYSRFELKGHNGKDIAAPLATPIYAPADGWIIEQTAKETGFGLRITIRHEVEGRHFFTLYGHMQRLEMDINVPWNWNNKQYPVRAGQVIGYVNSTGFSTGNHLHFGLYETDINGNDLYPNNGYGGAIDPDPYMFNQDPPNPMQFKTQNYKGELRIVLEADNIETWKALCKVYGVNPDQIDETIN